MLQFSLCHRKANLSVWYFSCSSKVYLEIDNRQCALNSKECFSSTDLAASFIAAEYLKSGLPYPIYSVSSKFLNP